MEVTLALGADKFLVPSSDLGIDPKDSDISYDSYSPILLKFKSEQIKQAIPEFVSSSEGVSYDLNVLIYPDFQGNLDVKLESYGLVGSYSNGKYLYDAENKLYRVSRNLDKSRWDMLHVEPSSLKYPPKSIGEFWVADCSIPVLKKFLFCTFEKEYLTHLVEFSALGQNLKIRDQLYKFITQYLESKRL